MQLSLSSVSYGCMALTACAVAALSSPYGQAITSCITGIFHACIASFTALNGWGMVALATLLVGAKVVAILQPETGNLAKAHEHSAMASILITTAITVILLYSSHLAVMTGIAEVAAVGEIKLITSIVTLLSLFFDVNMCERVRAREFRAALLHNGPQ